VRKLLIGLGVLVVVWLGVAFAGPLFVPTESIKTDIAAEVRKATGRTLSINGDLNFRILPKPGVSVNDVALSNAEQGGDTPMVRLESASVEVALFPLLTGNVQINRIVLRKPDILLEQYADGSNNWTFAPPEAGTAATSDGSTAVVEPGGSSDSRPPIRFDDVAIADGTLTYQTPDQSERVENIDMSLGAGSLTGPFRAEGSLMARGFDIDLTAAIGELVEDKATPINLRIATAGADINYSGVLSGATGTPRVSGQIEVRADDLSAMIASVSKGDAPPALKGKALELDGTVSASQEAVTVSDLVLRLGEDSATGAIDIALGESPTANVVVNMSQLDLDRLLAETDTTSSAGGGASPAPGSNKDGAATPAESGTAFAIPATMSASLETKIDALVYREGVIRQVVLNAEMADGVVNISRASAQLPGGSSASLVGLVSAPPSGPEFNGQAELSSDDLRSLMTWAGADVGAVPAERLRKMAGSVSVAATPENITLTDIDVSVDVSRLRGGVAIALRTRPGFGVGLSLDKLNLGAYLPEEAAAPAAGAASPAKPASGAKPESADTPTGLAALNAFDAILQVKVGELVFREQNIRGINLDSTLQAGNLEVRDASVANLEGAKVSAKGTLTDLDGSPAADLTVSVDAPNADRLLALAGASAPAPIGPGKLSGTFKGNLASLAIDTTMQALGANLKAVGTVAPLALPPRYDLTLDIKHPDASAFMARLGGDSAATGVKTGALAAMIAANGDLNASTLNANIGVGPGKILLDGKLAGLAAGKPTGALSLDVSHPDMASFVRTFASDFRPALAEPGPFALKASLDMQPDEITLPNREGRAGPVSYSGNARLATGGERPDLTAELNTSEIIVDWFLPVPANRAASGGGSAGAGASSGGASSGSGAARWSREPLDLSALQTADAAIKLGAPAITYTNIRVDQPQLALTVKNGVLDLNQLSGQAFGGSFGMTAQVADRDVPTMAYALNVKGADAAKFLGGSSDGGDKGVMSALELLFPISNVKLVSGTLGADLNVSSRGRSEFEMISNLGGKGAVQFTNAVIDGVDVCRISNQLDNLNGLEGFLGLATSAQGGQTKLASFDGKFDIANGVATLPQQQMNPDCATVSFAGATNLPQWLVDIQARAAFPAHPEFPGVVVEQKGPLDAPNTRLVNVNQINEFIASKAVGTALRKFLPGATQQQQPAQQGGQSPAPSQEPVDQFKNLLEGLIKRR
jgi:uncharacterized protein involved in outer membrane biogenesis